MGVDEVKSFYSKENAIIASDIDIIVNSGLPWNYFSEKNILITGGGGFLASYMVKSLLYANKKFELNLKVICLVRQEAKEYSRLSPYRDDSSLQFVLSDLSGPIDEDMTSLPDIDVIIHAASHASPKFYGVDPVGTLSPNVLGTINLLNYAKNNNVDKVLFFSSGEVYGQPLNPSELIKERDYGYIDPVNIRSCYAESKRMAETICSSYSSQYGIDIMIVRPFHSYGPGVKLDDGRVFADFVADVVARRDITLKSDGSAQRPFCYISDATIGFFTVLLKGKSCEAYNVGNPEAEISIKNLAEEMSNLFPDMKLKVHSSTLTKSNKYLKSPINRSCPSIEKIVELNWRPTIGIKEGFTRTIQSFLE